MPMNEDDRKYIREEIGTVREDIKGIHKRLDPLIADVARNSTHISWLKWAVCIVIGSLALAGVGAVMAWGGP